MITVTLSKPIQAHGDEISVLELEVPSFEQMQKLGTPVKLDAAGDYTVNTAVALRYVPELAKVPPSSLKELGPYDLDSLCWAVWRFFAIPPAMNQSS
ncbi:TPA: phage tail assembly protein [Citrobacter werkmanii]